MSVAVVAIIAAGLIAIVGTTEAINYAEETTSTMSDRVLSKRVRV